MSHTAAPTPTPHNSAVEGEFAKTVLMPGDPLRAKYIAENFLEDAVLVNNVRGIQGYTGTYKGKRISVMASGMGMPSMGLYSYELFAFYGVENIIRIGTAGSMNTDLKVRDILISMGACTDSNYAAQYGLPGTFAPIASFDLLQKAVSKATEFGTRFMVGNVVSSDCFYRDNMTEMVQGWQKMGVLAVEMETAALYMNAARLGKKALAIFTVSDSVVTGEALPAEDRQISFTEMMKIALEIA